MDLPPPTQPTGNEAQIFVDKEGEPLRLYVESNHMAKRSRPKLVRQLLRHGAMTGMAPQDAQIILVSEDAPESVRRVLRGQNPQATMLDIDWVDAAFERGSYADATEQWGGFLVRESTSDGERFYSPAQSPLPTPRTSPRQRVEPLPKAASPSIPARIPPPPPPAPLPPTLVQQPLPPAPIQQPLPSAPLQMLLPPSTPMQQPLDGQNPLAQALNNIFTLLQTPQQPAMHSSVPAQAWGPSGSVDSQAAEALSRLQNMLFNPSATHSPATPSQWPAFTQPIPTFQTPSHPQTFQSYRSASPATPVLSSTTPMKRRVPREDSTPSYASPRPETSDASTRKRKQRRVSYQDERRDDSSEDDDDSALPVLSTARQLFTNKRGEPIVFYVQIDMKNRRHILGEIKKYGGTLSSTIPGAKYVVLSRQSEYTKERIQEAIAANTTVVTSSFVRECVAEGAMLDPEPYGFNGAQVKGKRGRHVTIDMEELRRAHELEVAATRKARPRARDTPEEEEPTERANYAEQDTEMADATQASPSKPSTSRRRNGSTPSRRPRSKRGSVSAPIPSDSRSRSPTPPTKSVQLVPGRNLFTAEEREWFNKFIPHLLKYNPDLTNAEIGKRLHEKVPSHSAGSWVNQLSAQRDETNRTRKLAHIQARKRQLEAEKQVYATDYLAQDTAYITEYLNGGGANDKQDEEVWQELQEKHPCRTAPSWEEFWRAHGEGIAARIADMQEQDAR